MTTGKDSMRRGWARLEPVYLFCLMVLWGVLMIAPAALPH
jgi:hypothetical protein